jgi:hypothetical protein
MEVVYCAVRPESLNTIHFFSKGLISIDFSRSFSCVTGLVNCFVPSNKSFWQSDVGSFHCSYRNSLLVICWMLGKFAGVFTMCVCVFVVVKWRKVHVTDGGTVFCLEELDRFSRRGLTQPATYRGYFLNGSTTISNLVTKIYRVCTTRSANRSHLQCCITTTPRSLPYLKRTMVNALSVSACRRADDINCCIATDDGVRSVVTNRL